MATASGSLSSGGIVVPPASGWGDSGVTSTLNPDGSVSWCCTTWIVPLPVAAGDVLGTVSIPVRDNGPDNGFSTGGNNVVVMVGTPSADGSTFNVLQFTTTSGAGDLATMVLTFATPHTVAAGENLQIRLRAQTPGIFGPTPATHVSWSGPATARGPAYEIDISAAAWHAITSTAGFPSISTDGVWSFDPSAGNEIAAAVTLPPGASVDSLRIHLRRNNAIHPSVGTITLRINKRVFGATSTTSQSASLGPSTGTDWASVDVIPLLSGPLASAANQTMWLSLTTSGFVGFGDPSPQFDTTILTYN